jgi:hypothetical protein
VTILIARSGNPLGLAGAFSARYDLGQPELRSSMAYFIVLNRQAS